MPIDSGDELRLKKCRPCEGGTERLSRDQAEALLPSLSDWRITEDGLRIEKQWQVANFMAGIDFFNRVAELAEAEGHHPELHLTGFRNVLIELWTHAIGGLSENDFIVAAKIDRLPIAQGGRPLNSLGLSSIRLISHAALRFGNTELSQAIARS